MLTVSSAPHHVFSLVSCLKWRLVGGRWWGVMRKKISDGVHWTFRHLLSPTPAFALAACRFFSIFSFGKKGSLVFFGGVALVGRWGQGRGKGRLGLGRRNPDPFIVRGHADWWKALGVFIISVSVPEIPDIWELLFSLDQYGDGRKGL